MQDLETEKKLESSDMIWYKAHQSILNMYMEKIDDRISNLKNKGLGDELEKIVELKQKQLFGDMPNEDAVQKVFDYIMYEYKYCLCPMYGNLLTNINVDEL